VYWLDYGKSWLAATACAGVLAGAALPVLAAEPAQKGPPTDLTATLTKVMPGLEVDEVNITAVPGLYEVIAGPRVFYITADGNFLIDGDVIDLAQRTNITDERRGVVRVRAIDAVGEENMVVFAPKDPKYTVTVFTDIDCTYCRKLHEDMAGYNAKGIKMRYLAYPRAGLGSASYQKAVSVWCAEDRNAAMTKAKAGEAVPQKTCDNPVADQFALGGMLGVRGTPAMVLPDGTVVPGYVPPDRLYQALAGKPAAAGH